MTTTLIATTETIDALVAKYTPWKTMAELCVQPGNYRPTIRCTRAVNRSATKKQLAELLALANAYDVAQMLRGDERRAFRG